MQLNQRRRRFKPTLHGIAAVELALVLPVFMLVVLGIVEFGRAFMAEHLLAEASRLGARRAIVAGVTESEVKQLVKDFCGDTLGIRSKRVKVAVTIEDVRGQTVSGFSNADSGDMCTVTVTIPFDEISFLPANFLRNAQLSNACTMERE